MAMGEKSFLRIVHLRFGDGRRWWHRSPRMNKSHRRRTHTCLTQVLVCRDSKWLDPLLPARLRESAQILRQMAPHVVGTALFDHDLQGVPLGWSARPSWVVGPLGEDRPPSSERGVRRLGQVALLVRIIDQVEEHLFRPCSMEAVVKCSKVQMAAESHPSLAGPCTLAQDEVVAPRRLMACFKFVRARDAVPVPRQHRSSQVRDGGGDVEMVIESSEGAGGKARPRHDGRDVSRDLVGRLVVRIDPELAEGLSVITPDPDGGLVEHAERRGGRSTPCPLRRPRSARPRRSRRRAV